MKINIGNAAKLFFPNPNLEMIYFEAVANSVDAGATQININISIDSFTKAESLKVEITDNGIGFTDENLEKFSSLLEVEKDDHKGIGRLVYLRYFKNIEVTSYFGNKKRALTFNGKFDGQNKLTTTTEPKQETTLTFKEYNLEKIKTYDYVKPDAIKDALLKHFFPRFYNLKIENTPLKIRISLSAQESNIDKGFISDSKELDISQIPTLETEVLDANGLDLFEKIHLYYSVKENINDQSIITALSVDGRTIPIDIISGIPPGYQLIFLLVSNLFQGKANPSRQEVNMNDQDLKTVKKIFSDKVIEILNEKIPKIQEQNKKTTEVLEERYPHLQGFFDENPVGLIDRKQSLEIAQKKFFRAQVDILEAQNLTDEQYEKSLDMSSRVLTEYVLYRNLIIGKLKKIDITSSEADIHNIIIPMRKTFVKNNFHNDLYTNNAWLLDDKYMSYTTILSDTDMDELIKNITSNDEQANKNEKRPDIAIIFSGDPNTNSKVDVVIIELKKLGLPLAKKEEIVSQLRQRARKLLVHFPNKIQRIWFYGIVDFDDEFKISLLEDKFSELFSKGTVFYKEQPIILDIETKIEIPVGLYILSFDAFLNDADVRNSTFLNLLKTTIKNANSNPSH